MEKEVDLQGLFERQRRQEAVHAPGFEQLLEPKNSEGRSRFRFGLAYTLSAFLLICAVGAWWGLGHRSATSSDDPSKSRPAGTTAWAAASDFLLQIPGQKLLGEPRFTVSSAGLGESPWHLDPEWGTGWLAGPSAEPPPSQPVSSTTRPQGPENTDTANGGHDS